MSKSIQILLFLAIIGAILVEYNASGKSVPSSDVEPKLDSKLRKKIFMEELDEYQKNLEYCFFNRAKKY